ncbi:MAG: 2Fe-2S iron-sulfur cluster-binding protein, partial [Pseudomonadota bacterium]|nr:2Fe-2S iron-sulfur cluster-binding protein [Pseudomonadota bacterium]
MGFNVTVRPSGRAFSVDGDETVLEAALRNGVGLPYGCKNGACGTCRGRLVEGQLVHRAHSSSALSADDEAKGFALFCSSRPQSDIVIEARELT